MKLGLGVVKTRNIQISKCSLELHQKASTRHSDGTDTRHSDWTDTRHSDGTDLVHILL